jgi:Ser/Thr protein kinase RdoA (MazF antagonist)
LGTEETPDGQTVLYLEALRRRPRSWPWRDTAVVRRVLGALATFHAASDHADPGVLPVWDYDAVVKNGANRALENLERCGSERDLAPLLEFRPALRRIVDAIAPMRERLLSCSRLVKSPLHGDVHSGNVLFRKMPEGDVPVFIDWARARLGSPLEDVSSWLQSLSYWEPETARRHDTLLSFYLNARGLPFTSMAQLREGYWIAAASNVLAGALAHHLSACLLARADSAQRVSSFWCARDCLRILRRADALCR